MTAWRLERADVDAEIWDGPVTVTSWRPEPLAISAERVDGRPRPTYTGNPYSFAGHRFPKSPGRLL
jgi:hypothetical protein